MDKKVIGNQFALEVFNSLDKVFNEKDYSRESSLALMRATGDVLATVEAARLQALGAALSSPAVLRQPAVVEEILNQLGLKKDV
jgi:hypothetical protein